eukprot:Skav207200  [mRNA]  locus=scaffold4046:306422:306751:- [translate_table: standard]
MARFCANFGHCDPCVMFFSGRGCAKGNRCAFCHHQVAHAVQQLVRPRKQKRSNMKETILRQIATAVDQEELHRNLQESARRHPYMRTVIEQYLNKTYLASNQRQSVFQL